MLQAGLPSPLGYLLALTFIVWVAGTSITRHSAGTFLTQSSCDFLREAYIVIELVGALSVRQEDAVWHHLARGNWRGMCGVTGSFMEAHYIGFRQQNTMKICAFSMTHLSITVPLREALENRMMSTVTQ